MKSSRAAASAAVSLSILVALVAAVSVGPEARATSLPGQIGSWAEAGTPDGAAGPVSDPAPEPPSGYAGPDAAICLRGAFRAAEKEGLPGDVLAAVGLTEAGRAIDGGPLTIWPWSVNSEGNGRYFKDKASAIQWVREEQARGVRSIDVGCMQINLRWHPDAFSDLDEAFDPAANTAYSAKYLATLRSRYGSLDAAVGRYHSPTPWRQDGYREKVRKNTAFAVAARRYLTAVASADTPATSDTLIWGHRRGHRLSFTHGLFADAPPQPILPLVNKLEPDSHPG